VSRWSALALALAVSWRLVSGPVLSWTPPARAADQDREWEPDERIEHPNLELHTAVYTQGASELGRRTVVANQLLLAGEVRGRGTLGAGLAWVTLTQTDRGDLTNTTSVPGNGFLRLAYRPPLPPAWRSSIELGAHLVVHLGEASTANPSARVAHTYAVAMQAAWDSWRFADGRLAFALPLRVVRDAGLFSRAGQLQLDGALVLLLPEQNVKGDPFHRIVQAAAGYRLWPGDRWFLELQLRTVFLPSAGAFHEQSSWRAGGGLRRGPWRLALELLASIDEPYGWRGAGEGIWSLGTLVGVDL
jgi:hypothetical protein